METTPSADGTSSATHVYDKKAGAFTARVSAFDDDGGQAKIVFFVKVAEGPIAEITELTSSPTRVRRSTRYIFNQSLMLGTRVYSTVGSSGMAKRQEVLVSQVLNISTKTKAYIRSA